MGFFEKIENDGGTQGKLDLVSFESKLLEKMNASDILSMKYKAEENGFHYDKSKLGGTGYADIYEYDGSETITICPEPLNFIKEFADVSDNKEKANELFKRKIDGFKRIALKNPPLLRGDDGFSYRMWLNKTATGINLRPGNLNDDAYDFTPIKMSDDNVHGLIAGRTGSGKSVFINALILSLITEYAPWELDLYLADFKKVELSRYMNDADDANGKEAFTPHVKACAATGEIRYVASMIRHLVDCMNARNELFTRLGVTKIQEFRTTYHLVLPRVLLIVDEFQQMFTEATNREREEIQTMLNSITKLGRATGFHLIFASQEMSGTLRGNTLANFKIRMALPCNPQVSVDILGNSAAGDPNFGRGYVLVNTDSGDELSNKKYHVPFIETEKKDADEDAGKTPFYHYLDGMKLAKKNFDLDKYASQKFYREELQEREGEYLADLDRIKEEKNRRVESRDNIFDAVVLGKTVLYSERKNDKVSFYLERGRNKGVMIASPSPDDAARIRKLLAENLLRSEQETVHLGVELNGLVYERYRMDSCLGEATNHRYFKYESDGVPAAAGVYYLRRYARAYIENANHMDDLKKLQKLETEIMEAISVSGRYEEYRTLALQREKLLASIDQEEMELKNVRKELRSVLVNPVLEYLTTCSSSIVIIPKVGQKAAFEDLRIYKDIVATYKLSSDSAEASRKNIALVQKKLEELEKEKEKNSLAILQLKILKRAMMHYDARFADQAPENCSLTGQFESCYLSIQNRVAQYKKQCAERTERSQSESERSRQLSEWKRELAELDALENPLEEATGVYLALLNQFVTECYNSTYESLGYKKNKPVIPRVDMNIGNGRIELILTDPSSQKEISQSEDLTGICTADIIEVLREKYRTNARKSSDYKKVVFWLNGMDELDKIPNYVTDMIRDCINYNILAVAIITSELRDTMIRKVFDYAFVTGNVEKFYSMFDIKYTKQPLDSIVVNFGIRSKGFNIPFKMYKTDLQEVQAPDFIEHLLEE